jgi:DNA-directed RNA polymerase
MTWEWLQAMKPVLAAHIEKIRPKNATSDGHEIMLAVDRDTDNNRLDHLWLTALPIETLCAITIMELLRSQANESRSMGSRACNVITRVGAAVEREIQASDLVRKENIGLHPKHINMRLVFENKIMARAYGRQFRQDLLKGKNGGVTNWPFEWKIDVRARVLPVFDLLM